MMPGEVDARDAEIESLKRRLAEERRRNAKIDWDARADYLALRHRVENPHLYDRDGKCTEGYEGGPKRRVVTLLERMLEVAYIWQRRSVEAPEAPEGIVKEIWHRAFVELVVCRDSSMDRPDKPICQECAGIGSSWPTELVWISVEGHHPDAVDGRIQVLKQCEACEGLGFDINGSVEGMIDD